MTSDFMNDLSNNSQSSKQNSKLPDPDELNDHLSKLLDGKLGRLAHEIAEETMSDINVKDKNDPNEVFEKLIKNPLQLMDLIKKIGTKIDSRIKKGEINESELMAEATDMMEKMKNIPGMDNMEEMLNNMASKIGGKNAKFNMNAFTQKTKASSQRERMLRELERRQAEKKQNELESTTDKTPVLEKDLKFSKFAVENAEPNEKTPLQPNNTNKKKRKNKKKK